MHCSLNFFRERVALPCEEGAEGEVLDDGEFGKYLGVVHF